MYSSCLQSDVLPFTYLLTYVLLYSIFINYHSWKDSLKETINKPISVMKWQEGMHIYITRRAEKFIWAVMTSYKCFLFRKHIWQWSGEGRLSRLRRASSSFLLLSQLDDKFTFLVFQFLDGLFVEPRNSLILAKAASRLSVEQYSYLC